MFYFMSVHSKVILDHSPSTPPPQNKQTNKTITTNKQKHREEIDILAYGGGKEEDEGDEGWRGWGGGSTVVSSKHGA